MGADFYKKRPHKKRISPTNQNLKSARFDLPERHIGLIAVFFGVFADEGALAKALASKEQIFLVAAGGDDDGGNAEAERAKGSGEEVRVTPVCGCP